MGLQTKGSPDATYRRLAQTDSGGHSTARPVGGAFGGLLQSQTNHPFDLVVADLAGGPQTGLVTETSYAFGNEAITPQTYGESRRAQLSRHRSIAQTTPALQHDAGTESYRTRATRLLCQSFQFGSLRFTNYQLTLLGTSSARLHASQ
jgi:hypothetical protein